MGQSRLRRAFASQVQFLLADVGPGYRAPEVRRQVPGRRTIAATQIQDPRVPLPGAPRPAIISLVCSMASGWEHSLLQGTPKWRLSPPDGAVDFVGRAVVIGLGVGNDRTDVVFNHQHGLPYHPVYCAGDPRRRGLPLLPKGSRLIASRRRG